MTARAESPEARLAQLGMRLPPVTPATGTFQPTRRWGDLLFVSGHAAWENDEFLLGTLGAELDTRAGQRAARASALCCLAAIKAELGDLSRVASILKVFGMIRAVPDFKEHPLVMNGCSDLLVHLFDERGRHARAAVGMTSLPFGTAIEIDMTIAIQPNEPTA